LQSGQATLHGRVECSECDCNRIDDGARPAFVPGMAAEGLAGNEDAAAIDPHGGVPGRRRGIDDVADAAHASTIDDTIHAAGDD
jgi:hypothetical protein